MLAPWNLNIKHCSYIMHAAIYTSYSIIATIYSLL